MKTNESDTRIALQPESAIEQALLGELFTRLNNLGHEAPSHPSKVGSVLCFYTLDLDMYEALNHDLWEEADCGVNEHGKLDPEPGSRALVVAHGDESTGDATQEEIDEAVEMISDSVEEGDVTLSDFSPEEAEVAEELATAEDIAIGDLDYDDLQEYAKRIGIAANQSADDLRDILFALVNGWTEAAEEVTA